MLCYITQLYAKQNCTERNWSLGKRSEVKARKDRREGAGGQESEDYSHSDVLTCIAPSLSRADSLSPWPADMTCSGQWGNQGAMCGGTLMSPTPTAGQHPFVPPSLPLRERQEDGAYCSSQATSVVCHTRRIPSGPALSWELPSHTWVLSAHRASWEPRRGLWWRERAGMSERKLTVCADWRETQTEPSEQEPGRQHWPSSSHRTSHGSCFNISHDQFDSCIHDYSNGRFTWIFKAFLAIDFFVLFY